MSKIGWSYVVFGTLTFIVFGFSSVGTKAEGGLAFILVCLLWVVAEGCQQIVKAIRSRP